jgi:ribosomal-protein-alanine N-acetyltransferase
MNLLLHDMTKQNLEEVLRIEREVQSIPWTLGKFLDALQAGNVCKVLQLEGQIIGFAVMLLGVDDAEILDFAIAPEQQRKGFGRIMLERMLDFARTADKSRMVLEVRVSNRPALALYERVGFTRIGMRQNYYPTDSGGEDAILMGYKL